MRISPISLLTAALCSAFLFSTLPLQAQPVQNAEEEAVRLVTPIGHTSVMSSLAVSPDGKFALSGAWDNTGALWEVATGRELRRFGSSKAVRQVGFAGGVGGAPLQAFTVSYDDATLWDAASGQRLRRIVPPVVPGEEYQFDGGAVSPDGMLIAVRAERWKPSPYVRHLRLYNAKTGAELFGGASVLAGVDVNVVVFSPDSKRLLIQPTSFDKSGSLYVLDTATGRRLTSLQSPTGTSSVGVPHFSPDGKFVVASSLPAGTNIDNRNDTLLVWSWPEGALLRTLPNQGDIDYMAIAPGGDRAALSVGHSKESLKSILTVSLEDGSLLARARLRSFSISDVAYLPGTDGLLVATNQTGRSIARVDNAGTTVAQEFGDPGIRNVAALTSSSSGSLTGLVDVSSVPTLNPEAPLPLPRYRLWDFRRGVFVGPPLRIDGDNGVAVTPKTGLSLGRNAVSAEGGSVVGRTGDPDTVITWNSRTGARRILESAWSTGSPWISPDGTLVAVPHDEEVRLFDTRTGSVVWSKVKPKSENYSGGIRTGIFSPDNSRLVTGDMWGNLQVWDVAAGTVLRQWHTSESYRGISDIRFVPGHNEAAVSVSESGQSALWNLDTGTLVREYSKPEKVLPVELQTAAISGDGKKAAFGGSDGLIHLWDIGTGVSLGILRGHSSDIASLRWEGGVSGPRLASTSRDGTTRVWETGAGVPRQTVAIVLLAPLTAAMSPVSSMDWVAFRLDGTFEGSEGGTSRVHFARGLQTFAVDQFSEAFLRSGLVASALPLAGQSIADSTPPPPNGGSIAGAVAQGTPPTVRLTVPTTAASTLEILVAATEQGGGGIKAIRLYQNGRLVGGPTALRGIVAEAISGATTTKRFVVSLASGVNVFRAVAYSKTDLESTPAETSVTYNPAQAVRPALYVLAVGINAYQDATMNLAYARPDAEALAKFFSLPGGKAATLFSEINVTQLVDAAATGSGIAAKLTAITAAAKPDDVVFLYFAGHGETADGSWYFLPHEMRQMALPERVKEFGIPWSRIEAAVGKIAARKIVLVVDACKSGAALDGAVRGGADSEQQALAIMARAQGIHILTAATGQQYASEVKELGHGILTYALLEGLNGKGATGIDSDVFVRGLLSYVEDRVPSLSKKYRGSEQYPVPFERGQNFPLVGK